MLSQKMNPMAWMGSTTLKQSQRKNPTWMESTQVWMKLKEIASTTPSPKTSPMAEMWTGSLSEMARMISTQNLKTSPTLELAQTVLTQNPKTSPMLELARTILTQNPKTSLMLELAQTVLTQNPKTSLILEVSLSVRHKR